MLLKGRYLEGSGGDDLKQRFRRLQLEGEEQLARQWPRQSPAAREGRSAAAAAVAVGGRTMPCICWA